MAGKSKPQKITVGEWADRFLVEYEETHKASSAGTIRAALKRFRVEFGDRQLSSIDRLEAKDWARETPDGAVLAAISCMNAAVADDLLDKNPFRGLGKKGKGRSEEAPPTEVELDRLLDACSVHGAYAPQMRALVVFAAFTGVRPGELYCLEWGDIDMDAMRVDVQRRLYRGKVDLPKSGKPRRIALTPPARDALLTLPPRIDKGLVFTTKTGKRFSQSTLQAYWNLFARPPALTSTSIWRRSITRSTTCM